MQAEIITIGDELLIGQVVDTNSAWMAQRMNEIGIRIHQITSVSDHAGHIIEALDKASERVDIIIMTGGLGPTRDDITKKTLCTYFDCGLRNDQESLNIIKNIFESRGREITPINIGQADVPEKCQVLLNRLGTAPGMWFDENDKIYISLPGVPAEMKALIQESVIPLLKERFKLAPIVHKTILTQGIGESFLSEKISTWEDNLPDNMKLAYLPGEGMVRLRISAAGKDEKILRKEVEQQAKKLESLVGEFIYGYGDDRLEAIVGRMLRDSKKTLSTAESCTGGFIAHRITSVPGSSEYYLGSIIGYANSVKIQELGVDFNTLEQFGAVSQQVVEQMSAAALKKFGSDYAIACSGIAGPSGGTKEKPVGTVWIAIASRDEIITRKLQLGRHRLRVILETANHCLNELRKMLLRHQ